MGLVQGGHTLEGGCLHPLPFMMLVSDPMCPRFWYTSLVERLLNDHHRKSAHYVLQLAVFVYVNACMQVCRDAGFIELHCTGLAVVPEGAPVHSWLGRSLSTGGEWEQVGIKESRRCFGNHKTLHHGIYRLTGFSCSSLSNKFSSFVSDGTTAIFIVFLLFVLPSLPCIPFAPTRRRPPDRE